MSRAALIPFIPQHNPVLACRGSAQFFQRLYQLCLRASFRTDFTMEQLTKELVTIQDGSWTIRPHMAGLYSTTEAEIFAPLGLGELPFGVPIMPVWTHRTAIVVRY